MNGQGTTWVNALKEDQQNKCADTGILGNT
jgi:hypothetical protein